MRSMNPNTLRMRALMTQGFDASTFQGFKAIRVKCSQCEALVINGIATHEHGCPHAVHECNGCNALIPMRQRYCENCN